MPKISVIVPIYNVEKYIERCVCSLFEQTLDDIEYIFVDDCSADKSVDMLCAVMKRYPNRLSNIKFLQHKVNKGPSITRNDGLSIATGQYVIFCDSDDYIDICAYELMYKKAISNNADIVACGVRVISVNGNKSHNLLFNTEILSRDSLKEYDKVEGGVYSATWNKLIKREFLHKHKILFDASTVMWEDLYVSLKARFFSKQMYIVDLPLYNYCLHEGSVIGSNVLSKAESQVKVVRLIENFFIANSCQKEFSKIIAFLKYKAKHNLLENHFSLWKTIFPEAKKELFAIRSWHGPVLTFKYFMYSYLGRFGYFMYNILIRIKSCF